MRITLRVSPGARRDHVGGRYGDGDPPVLVVRVAAPATDGRANERVVSVLASALGVAAGAVTIVVGAGHRTKVVEVEGADPAVVEDLLAR